MSNNELERFAFHLLNLIEDMQQRINQLELIQKQQTALKYQPPSNTSDFEQIIAK